MASRTAKETKSSPGLDVIGGLLTWDERVGIVRNLFAEAHERASIRPKAAALRAMAKRSFRNRQTIGHAEFGGMVRHSATMSRGRIFRFHDLTERSASRSEAG